MRYQTIELRNQTHLLLAWLVFLTSFFLVAHLRNSFAPIDLQANTWAESIQMDSLTAIAVIVAYVFDTTSLIAVSMMIAAYLFYKNCRRHSALLLATMGGDALIVSITKEIVHSPRPLNGLVYDSGFSFPSGHTMACIVFCGLIVYLAWQRWKSLKTRIIHVTLSIVVIFTVAFDRIYLNVHWFSDVVGGCLLGLFWLTFSLWSFKCIEKLDKD